MLDSQISNRDLEGKLDILTDKFNCFLYNFKNQHKKYVAAKF